MRPSLSGPCACARYPLRNADGTVASDGNSAGGGGSANGLVLSNNIIRLKSTEQDSVLEKLAKL